MMNVCSLWTTKFYTFVLYKHLPLSLPSHLQVWGMLASVLVLIWVQQDQNYFNKIKNIKFLSVQSNLFQPKNNWVDLVTSWSRRVNLVTSWSRRVDLVTSWSHKSWSCGNWSHENWSPFSITILKKKGKGVSHKKVFWMKTSVCTLKN